MPRLAVAACLVLALVAASAMMRPTDATVAAETSALSTEAHALVADLQAAAATQADHPLALLDAPEAFQALTIYRDHGSFRLTAPAAGEGLLTFTDSHGTERLHVRFDRTGVLATQALS